MKIKRLIAAAIIAAQAICLLPAAVHADTVVESTPLTVPTEIKPTSTESEKTVTVEGDVADGRDIHVSFDMLADCISGTNNWGENTGVNIMGLWIYPANTSSGKYWRLWGTTKSGQLSIASHNGNTATVPTHFDIIITPDTTNGAVAKAVYINGVECGKNYSTYYGSKSETLTSIRARKASSNKERILEITNLTVTRGVRDLTVSASKKTDGDDLKVSYSYTDLSDEHGTTAKIFAVAYGENNRMIAFGAETAEDYDTVNGYKTGTITLTDAVGATSVKLMVWDSLTNMVPYCDVVPVQ